MAIGPFVDREMLPREGCGPADRRIRAAEGALEVLVVAAAVAEKVPLQLLGPVMRWQWWRYYEDPAGARSGDRGTS